MDEFMMGAIAMASAVAGLFFLRFWRETGDRLFLMFAISFFLLGLTRVALAAAPAPLEDRFYLYWMRLVAFGLIIVAIIDKNRSRQS
jgi:uncharacterized membrane protein YkvI